MDLAVYAALFVTAFAAGSVLPLQSEPVLAGLLLTGAYPAWLLVLVAGTGNMLGAVTNWLLGRVLDRFHDRWWFPVGPVALEWAQAWYRRYGRWSLLLSWVPFLGDPLVVAAGVMREPLPAFLLLVGIAKFGRYIAVAALVAS